MWGILFDPAVHTLFHAHEGRPIDFLLRHLGVRELCEVLALPHAYGIRIDDTTLDVPAGIEGVIEAHLAAVRPFLTTTVRFFRADPSLAPAGEHFVVATSLAPFEHPDGWERAREPYAEALLGLVERLLLPELRELSPSVLSGVRTARLVRQRMGPGDRAPLLQAPDMPIPV